MAPDPFGTPATIHTSLILDVLAMLDSMEREITDWEAQFLESLFRQTYPLTAKQQAVLVRMAEEYLPATIAAELHEQLQRP